MTATAAAATPADITRARVLKLALPIVLVGKTFWKRLVDFDYLAEQGMTNWGDNKLFKMVDTAEEGWDHIRKFWKSHKEAAAAS